MIGHRNRFIRDVDLSESTSLIHLLNRHTREDDEDVETQMIKHSPFYGQKQFADLINNNTGLSIIDLNIRTSLLNLMNWYVLLRPLMLTILSVLFV